VLKEKKIDRCQVIDLEQKERSAYEGLLLVGRALS
jgi:hypothetical protein